MDESEPRPQRPLISREVILDYRRRRFTDALAEVCSERGFREATVARIVSRAGTSRNTFYELFENRDDAFMSMLDRGIDELIGRVEASCDEASGEPLAQVQAGLEGAVGWIVERPHQARACMVDAAGATPTSLVRQQEAVTRLAEMLKVVAPSDVPRPPTLEEYLVGGVQSVLRQLVVDGEIERAPTLVPDLSAVLLAPYLADERR
jgi:AcrR family transcriptional regulator